MDELKDMEEDIDEENEQKQQLMVQFTSETGK